MTKLGRPKKTDDEKFIARSVRFHPRLWEEFSELVPAGERSALIQRLLERELKRRRRAQAQASPLLEPASHDLPGGEDPWLRAALAAKEYYDTDPEAVEWAMFVDEPADD